MTPDSSDPDPLADLSPPAPAAPPASDLSPATDSPPPTIARVESASSAPIPSSLSLDPPELPPAAGPSLARPPVEPISHPLIFHGRTDEYFRIWIVNTLLTLLTLGVFFAWAKVRKRRYLRGSTELLGHRFDYRAEPLRLLFGHAVVLCLLLGYSLFGVVYPWIRFGVIALGVVLLPWIVVRSMSFNAHNTVYRGLCFRFNRSLSAAAKVYLLEPVLLVLSLGLYFPAWQRSKRDYIVNNHRFGDAYFRFNAGLGPFYATYLFAGLILFAALFLGGTTIAYVVTQNPGLQPTLVQLIPFFTIYAFGFFLGRHLIYAQLFNHIWNHTRLDEHRFRARLSTGKWLGLQLTNLAAILLSAGMLYPWALIRAQRYAASCLEFVPAAPIDSIQHIGSAVGSATGDMAAEFIGLDFGL